MQYIFWYDWAISSLLIIIVLLWAKRFVRKNQDDKLIVRYFKRGLVLKLVGCLAYVIYHQYIYNGGDTFSYFDTARQIRGYFHTDFDRFIKLTFYPVKSSMDVREDDVWLDYIMVMSESNAFQVRFATLIQFITFDSFIPTSLIFTLLSYAGIWKCFRTFDRYYKNQTRNLAIAFLYIPTVIFWGSGLGKDSVCIGSICALTASFFGCFIFKEKIIKNLASICLFTLILLIVKPYIAISFLPPMALALVFLRLKKIKNTVLKIITYPLSGLLIAFVVTTIFDFTSANFSKYAVENLAEKIVQSSQSMKTQAGSSYDLGIQPEAISSIEDLLPFFPKGVIATLFRPWMWEVKNPAMLLSALEGLAFLILTIIILYKGRLYKPFLIIVKDPILFSNFIYVIMFAGLVGLSTGNFGTLVRYKLPIMPYFGLSLLIIYSMLKKKKVNINPSTPGNNYPDIL